MKLIFAIGTIALSILMLTVSQQVANASGNNETTSTNITTNTQLKTYTDPTGFFTLQYPVNWTVSQDKPLSGDRSSVMFKNQPGPGGVSISVQPSMYRSPEEFRNGFSSSYANYFAGWDSKRTVLGEGFGVYSIGCYDTYYLLDTNYINPSNPIKEMSLESRIGYQDMRIIFIGYAQSFDQQMPMVQKMINSIKITSNTSNTPVQAATQSSSNSTSNTSVPFTSSLQPYSSNPPQLQILGTNSFYDNNQYNPALHIVGEVLNYGTQMATFVKVVTTLYNANNQVVGTDYTYTTPSHIMPGKKAPFEIVVNRKDISGGDFRNVHHFSLQLV